MGSEGSAGSVDAAGRTRRDAARTVAVFYLAAALLNGPAILRTAERLEHGGVAQQFLVAVVGPLARISRGLGVDRLRAAAERLADCWFAEFHPATPAGSAH